MPSCLKKPSSTAAIATKYEGESRSGTHIRNMRQLATGATALLRLDVRRPYHLAPFLGFVGDKLAEFGGCHRQRLSVQVGETRPQLGFDNGPTGFLVEPLDDFRERFP